MQISENSKIIRNMIRLNRNHQRVVEHFLSETGVYRSQYHLLMHISACENQSQKEIAEALDVSTATVAITIKKLERGGYLSKAMDEKDNRSNRIVITEKGRKVIDESHQLFAEIDDAMLVGFSHSEKEAFASYIERVEHNLDVFHKTKSKKIKKNCAKTESVDSL